MTQCFQFVSEAFDAAARPLGKNGTASKTTSLKS